MIKKQLDRRSERQLKITPLTEEQINKLKLVSNSTASSINGQGASIIFITDSELKNKFGDWNWGQEHIKKAPLFILFLIDLQRTLYAFDKNDRSLDLNDETTFQELYNVGMVDATIKAQAIVDAALSMDLGTCYIGGVRTYQEKIIEALELPEQVIPVLGLTVGHIESQEDVKPRMDTIFMENYDLQDMKNQVDIFDKKMAEYYSKRQTNKKYTDWSKNTASTYNAFFKTKDFYKTQKSLMDKKYKK